MGRLFLGTSGYHYKHWEGIFYPPGLPRSRWLEFYCKHFDTLELNVTFYRLPARNIFEGWYKNTPPDFVFTAKGSRFITHFKRMKECRQPLRVFKENASGLRKKLATVLWQLPPNLKYNEGRLVEFCGLLNDEYPETRHAFEFRHETWLQQGCYDILTSHGFAICMPLSPAYPRHEGMTAPFSYLRFHSGELLGNSCYTGEELAQWGTKISAWLEENDLYVYFNNDAFGFAIDNARQLRRYISDLFISI